MFAIVDEVVFYKWFDSSRNIIKNENTIFFEKFNYDINFKRAVKIFCERIFYSKGCLLIEYESGLFQSYTYDIKNVYSYKKARQLNVLF